MSTILVNSFQVIGSLHNILYLISQNIGGVFANIVK